MLLLHRVVVLAAVAAMVTAQPQRRPSSPLEMGMRFLNNLRTGISNTFQGMFGGTSSEAKEVAPHPPPQQLNQPPRPPLNQPPRPPLKQRPVGRPTPAQVLPPVVQAQRHPHDPTTEDVSSNFKVVHDSGTINPNPHHTDPVQSNFDFDKGTPFPPSLGHVEAPSFLPPRPDSVISVQRPTEGPSQFSNSGFTNFGSNLGSSGGSAVSSVQFGNSASFTLGRPQQRTQHSGGPYIKAREDSNTEQYSFDQSLQPTQRSGFESFSEKHQPSLTLLPESEQPPNHPVVVHLSHSAQTTHTPSYRTPEVIQNTPVDYHRTTEEHRNTLTENHNSPLLTTARLPATTTHKPSSPEAFTKVGRRPGIRPQPYRVNKKPVESHKPNGAHINIGTKINVSPKQREDGSKGSEVSGYEFGYGVLDKNSGNQFFHAEKRENKQTKGSYKIQLADGRVQTVTYVADDSGFHPKIKFEGEARYVPTADEE